MELIYNCLRCGKCCHEVPEEEIEDEFREKVPDKAFKRIPLFAEEADRLEKYAKEKNIDLHLIEDLVFPDIKNQKIIVLTYRIMLDNAEKVCPFYEANTGCRINEDKPLACKAYPLALKTEDAFNMKITIDPLCNFTIDNRLNLEKIDYKNLLKIYQQEFGLAKNLLIRSKQAIIQLMEKQNTGEIVIPQKIDPLEYNKYLKEWDRVIL